MTKKMAWHSLTVAVLASVVFAAPVYAEVSRSEQIDMKKGKTISTDIKKDDKIGDIVDPLTGTIHATLVAPNDGILFTLREYPVVYEGSLIARIFGDNSGKN